MECRSCLAIFERIGAALNSPIDTEGLISLIVRTLSEELHVAGCAIRLLSRDRRTLDAVASWGLSARFLDKGPVDAERSVAEALEGRPVLILDCRTNARIQYPAAFAEEGLVTLLTVPMSTRGQVIGVLRLFCRERREFKQQDLEVIQVVGAFCAAALVHSMFHKILEDVTVAVRSSLDLPAVLQSVARVVTEDLRAKGCVIELLGGDGRRLDRHEAYGLPGALVECVTGSSQGAVAEALVGACVQVLDAASDPRISFAEAAARAGVASILYVPLMMRDKVVGVLQLFTQRPYEFSEEEVFLMRGIGDQVALAIRNAQMYAAVKLQYRDLADDFQRWFEQYQVHPNASMP
jgi:GAF domain-containing protein